jgi:hypothetical protein
MIIMMLFIIELVLVLVMAVKPGFPRVAVP